MDIAVKICGINRPDAVSAAVEAGATWLGFVFFAGSPRCVLPAEAAALAASVPPRFARVGLFVDPSDDEVAAALAATPLDALQLYASLARIVDIRERFDVPVWRAVGVATAADLPRSAAGADRLVIETQAPKGASRPGGNARPFDWTALRGWVPPAPWLLAGGLTVANVGEAISTTGAIAVDVSSGVECRPGQKDPAMIRQFIAVAGRQPGTADRSLLPFAQVR